MGLSVTIAKGQTLVIHQCTTKMVSAIERADAPNAMSHYRNALAKILSTVDKIPLTLLYMHGKIVQLDNSERQIYPQKRGW